MIHFQQSIQNTKGDALIGYFVKLADTSDDSAISIYADSSLTPIVSVSGVDNGCLVDSDGMADFWVNPGTYHMDIYATDSTTLQERKTFVQFGVPAADYGDVTVNADGTWTVDAVNATTPTATGLAVLGAASQAAARTAIGAGTGGGDLVSTNNLSDVANPGTSRTNLGLGTIATQSAASVAITGGSVTGITDITVADGGTGASTASGARTNLGAAASGAVTGGDLTMSTNRLLGRTTASTGAIEEITVGSGLVFSAGSLTAGPGTGSAGWSTVATYDFGTQAAAANVDFTGLDSYVAIQVVLYKITTSASIPRGVLFSINNGTSYSNSSGDYQQTNGDGTLTARNTADFTTASVTTAQTLTVFIRNTHGDIKTYTGSGTVPNGIYTPGGAASSSPINAIRVSVTSGQMNGGKIYVIAQ